MTDPQERGGREEEQRCDLEQAAELVSASPLVALVRTDASGCTCTAAAVSKSVAGPAESSV